MKAHLVHILIAPDAGAQTEHREEVRAKPGFGLEGDRYAIGIGSFSRWPAPYRDVSLISLEGLAEFERVTGHQLTPEASRRNLVTTGVDLNTLLKKEFSIGDVRFEGMRLCQPCKYLARKTGIDNLVEGLRDRGGLRARIINEGVIRVGDPIDLGE